MRLKFTPLEGDRNGKPNSLPSAVAAAACLAWTVGGELLTVSDNQQALRWARDGRLLGPAAQALFSAEKQSATSSGPVQTTRSAVPAPIFYTCITTHAAARCDLLALGSSDGRLVLVSRASSPDKFIDAHLGAVLAVSWNCDASALLSSGEDGSIKIWSRAGMLRSLLMAQGSPVFSACWSPDSNQVLLTSNRMLTIKPLQPSSKSLSWLAHDGCVLQVAWSSASNLIVSCGEDNVFKIWDSFGREIFVSSVFEHPITSVAWSPAGDRFALGGFNFLRICDKQGWTSCSAPLADCGSVAQLAWTPDGTLLACSTALGHTHLAHFLGCRVNWRHIDLILEDDTHVIVNDAQSGTEERYEVRDSVIKVGLGHRAIVLVSASQTHVLHESRQLNSFETSSQHGRASVLRLARSCFAVADSMVGVTVHSYGGKVVSTIKLARPELLSDRLFALCDDALAIRDPQSDCSIAIYDVQTAHQICIVRHNQPPMEIALDHIGHARLLAFFDRSGDLYVSRLTHGSGTLGGTAMTTTTAATSNPFSGKADTDERHKRKIGTMVESICFAEDSPLLAAVVDDSVVVWMSPSAVFVDADLVPLTRVVLRSGSVNYIVGELNGGSPQTATAATSVLASKAGTIRWFAGSLLALRTADGATVAMRVGDPYSALLHEYATRKKWHVCLRACRTAKSCALWATLAALALTNGNDLDTAEVAYAAIGEAHKVNALCAIRDLPSNELRAAEICQFKSSFGEAEAAHVNSGNAYTALRMWIDLYNWDRALDLALRRKEYLAIVLVARREYLARMGMGEVNRRFMEFANEEINQQDIERLIKIEEDRKLSTQAR